MIEDIAASLKLVIISVVPAGRTHVLQGEVLFLSLIHI